MKIKLKCLCLLTKAGLKLTKNKLTKNVTKTNTFFFLNMKTKSSSGAKMSNSGCRHFISAQMKTRSRFKCKGSLLFLTVSVSASSRPSIPLSFHPSEHH